MLTLEDITRLDGSIQDAPDRAVAVQTAQPVDQVSQDGSVEQQAAGMSEQADLTPRSSRV